jgi:hypothetical protein
MNDPSHEKARGFWEHEFRLYLQEHRHPLNRASHLIGIPILIATGVWGLVARNWWLLGGGQVVGWFFQLAGHAIEKNRPALTKRPISVLMGPLMVVLDLCEMLGLRLRFAQEARRGLGQSGSAPPRRSSPP